MSVDTELTSVFGQEYLPESESYPDFESTVPTDNVIEAEDIRPFSEVALEAQQGSGVAFGEMWQRCSPALLRMARRIVGPDRAEDVIQSTAMKAWRNIGDFDMEVPEESIEPGMQGWLYRIAKNTALDVVRRDARIKFSSLEALDEGSKNSYLDRHAQHVEDPGDVVASQDIITRAVATVPSPFREAIVGMGLEDQTYEEHAAVAGVPTGTVRSRLHRGRTVLRAAIRNGDIDGLYHE